MSTFPQNAQHSQSQEPFTDLTAVLHNLLILNAKLHENTSALIAFCEREATLPSGQPATPSGADATRQIEQDGGETRCYYFSPSILRQERELLRKYRAEDFGALLTETHTLLHGLVKTMKSIHPEARFRGSALSSLGCLLEQAATLALRMRNVYANIKRI